MKMIFLIFAWKWRFIGHEQWLIIEPRTCEENSFFTWRVCTKTRFETEAKGTRKWPIVAVLNCVGVGFASILNAAFLTRECESNERVLAFDGQNFRHSVGRSMGCKHKSRQNCTKSKELSTDADDGLCCSSLIYLATPLRDKSCCGTSVILVVSI